MARLSPYRRRIWLRAWCLVITFREVVVVHAWSCLLPSQTLPSTRRISAFLKYDVIDLVLIPQTVLRQKVFHRITECLGLEETSVGHLVQPSRRSRVT